MAGDLTDMRINLNTINLHLTTALELQGVAIEHNDLDVIIARLWDDQLVALHLIERDIDLTVIETALEYDRDHGWATLFMLWSPMLLPEDGQQFRLYDWMHALIALHGGLIYGFEMRSDRAYFYPVYFEAIEQAGVIVARYGETVQIRGLQAETVTVDSPYLRGTWRVADFEGFNRPASDSEAHANASTDPHYDLSRESTGIEYCYRVMNVPIGADWNTIRVAYRALARQFHPDLNPTPEALIRMQQINIAYARLREFLSE